MRVEITSETNDWSQIIRVKKWIDGELQRDMPKADVTSQLEVRIFLQELVKDLIADLTDEWLKQPITLFPANKDT